MVGRQNNDRVQQEKERRTEMCRFLLWTIFFMLIVSGHAAEREIRILSIGNSYSEQSTAQTPEIAHAMGIPLRYASAHIGGSSMGQVLDALIRCRSTGKPQFSCMMKESMPERKILRKNTPCNLWNLLAEEKWDMVLIMPYRNELLDRAGTWKTAEKLVHLIRERAPQAEILIHGIWTPRADDPFYQKHKISQSDFMRLTEAFCNSLAADLGVRVVPVGTAVRLTREESRDHFVVPDPSSLKQFSYPELPSSSGDVVGSYRWERKKRQNADAATPSAEKNEWVLQTDSIHLNGKGMYLQALVMGAVLLNIDPGKVVYAPAFLSDADAAEMRLYAAKALREPVLRELPNPPPEFKPVGSGLVLPELKVFDYRLEKENLIQPSFCVGNKMVSVQQRGRWRERSSVMYRRIYGNLGERPAFFLEFHGGKGQNAGFPFQEIRGEKTVFRADAGQGTVEYVKPYLNSEGKKCRFRYQLKSLPGSRVELTWDSGSRETVTPVIHFPSDSSFQETRVAFREKIPVGKEAKERRIYRVRGPVCYAPDDPGEKMELDIGTGEALFALGMERGKGDSEKISVGRISLPGSSSGRIVIHLGVGTILKQKQTPPPVGGIDFWKEDMIELATSPTRNLMPNPGFEQGFRYWTWAYDGKYKPGSQPSGSYSLSRDAKFGKRALQIHGASRHGVRTASLFSFPMQLEKGKTYTVSFYAKSLNRKNALLEFRIAAASYGSRFGNPNQPEMSPEGVFRVPGEWKRFSRTFVADQFGIKFFLHSDSDLLLDAIQLEEGKVASEFISPPLEGELKTSDSRNDIVFGTPVNPEFVVFGKPGAGGVVTLSVSNVYRETIARRKFSVRIGPDGTETVPLRIPEAIWGKGIYVVRAEYRVPGYRPYTDFYRLSIMTPLQNLHATSTIPGTMTTSFVRITEQEKVAAKFREWGFGSTSWVFPSVKAGGPPPEWQRKYSWIDNTTEWHGLLKKNRIVNVQFALWDSIVREMDFPGREADGKAFREGKISMRVFSGRKINEETERRIEETAFRLLKGCDPESARSISWGNEEESSDLPAAGLYDEYLKYQRAVVRGAKRAGFLGSPTSGTAGYSRLRGFDAMSGYLRAANRAGLHYDAVAVHPYGNIDGGILGPNEDMDAASAHLIREMKKYGLGKEVPIYYTECGNNPPVNIPQWSSENGDLYRSGKPSYSWGNREFLVAASYLRKWIICLKYWPQVYSTNVWIDRPFMDLNFTPMFLCKAANTFGNLLPDVEYLADIRPSAGVRGYAFRLKKDSSGIAAIWFVSKLLELSREDNPVFRVKFRQPVKWMDMFENERIAIPGRDGFLEIPLTPAPLFIKAANADMLAEDLAAGELLSSAKPFEVFFRPCSDGGIQLELQNLLNQGRKGTIVINGENVEFNLQPLETGKFELPFFKEKAVFGKRFRKQFAWTIHSGGKPYSGKWEMDYFYVPFAGKNPDWSRIPSFPIENMDAATPSLESGEIRMLPRNPDDFSASCQVAWNHEKFYLRVTVRDDKFLVCPELWKRGAAEDQLWLHDGCLEVYFDCGADGRKKRFDGYDINDYRYDFSIGKSGRSGPGMVNRLIAVDHQLADGINMPSKQEAAEKIQCDFQRTKHGYCYTISFGQRYLEPLMLREGFLAGFALYLHDFDDPDRKTHKGLTTGITPGKHCQMRPFDWPLMILKRR